MQNSDLRREIEFAMRRVPRLGGGWRYIPLHQLPEGTELIIDAEEATTDSEPRKVNNKDEIDVLRLPEGEYTLCIGIYPTMSFKPYHDEQISVKPHNVFLAPSSVFEANVDLPNLKRETRYDNFMNTFRLTTGKIRSIVIPGTGFILKEEDLVDKSNKPKAKPVRPKRSKKNRQRPLRDQWM